MKINEICLNVGNIYCYPRSDISNSLKEIYILQERNEIETGIKSLLGLHRILRFRDPFPKAYYVDKNTTKADYSNYAKRIIDLNDYASDDISCFWSVLSRYYPFNNDDVETYMKYINPNELSKNIFASVSEDMLNSLKLYFELNR